MATPTNNDLLLGYSDYRIPSWSYPSQNPNPDDATKDYVRSEFGLPSLSSEAAMLRMMAGSPVGDYTNRLRNQGYNPAAAASLNSRIGTQSRLQKLDQADVILRSLMALRSAYKNKRAEIPGGTGESASAMAFLDAF